MIEQLQFALTPPEGARVFSSCAYRLYGWLMEQLPAELGDALHQQGEHPIAHSLRYSRELQKPVWTISLLNDTVRDAALPVLEDLQAIPLHELPLSAAILGRRQVGSARELILTGRECGSTRARITLLSPCSFRQDGRYVIFPQEGLLLQSLVLHWNSAFPEYALTDSVALDALAHGLRIADYDLRTTRYPMKSASIQGFIGSVTMDARLAPPLLELWNALLAFAPYGGIGIKTTLGMGGAAVDFLPPRTR